MQSVVTKVGMVECVNVTCAILKYMLFFTNLSILMKLSWKRKQIEIVNF
jgi:hypothetical protein